MKELVVLKKQDKNVKVRISVSLYLCKTKPKCIGLRKLLDQQTFSHLPYLSDTLAKTALFGKDGGLTIEL